MDQENTALKLNINECYQELFELKKRYYLLLGGRHAGRSYAAGDLILALMTGMTGERVRIAIMRQTFGDIRSSIYKQVIDRLEDTGLINDPGWKINDSTMTIRYKDETMSKYNEIIPKAFRTTGSSSAKLKSLTGFTHIFIEEAEEVDDFEKFNNLDESVRDVVDSETGVVTVKTHIILLCNPPVLRHWIVQNYLNLNRVKEIDEKYGIYYKPALKVKYQNNWCFIHTTYLDNIQHISEENRRKIENNKQNNPEYYYSKNLGLITKGKTGLIYKNIKAISEKAYDEIDRVPFYGVDFGYANDPAAVIEIKKVNNRIYCKEIVYERELQNADMYDLIEQRVGKLEDKEFYADAQERKSIDELNKWLNIKPSEKGQGSIRAGIKILQGYEIYYVETSLNIRKEFESYTWALDKNKEPTSRPIDSHNHALDALRYAVVTRYHSRHDNVWEYLYPAKSKAE